MDINLLVLKEPRGLIRAIQVLFAILAFATTAGFGKTSSLEIGCPEADPPDTAKYTYAIEYPFEGPLSFEAKFDCNKSNTVLVDYNYKTGAQFFVATGVLSLLYSIVALTVYIVFYYTYESNQTAPVIDLVVTGILTIFWACGSIAWAANVSSIKGIQLSLSDTVCRGSPFAKCTNDGIISWATLDSSLVFGFGNVLIWLGSLWFVYKETHFHQQDPTSTASPRKSNYDDLS